MLSQYSWGDFAKFILLLAVPYYAYVAWKYYREEIREWFSNRGQPNVASAAAEPDDEVESVSSSAFIVREYAQTSSTPAQPAAASGNWLPPAPAAQPTGASDVTSPPVAPPLPPSTATQSPPDDEDTDEVSLEGPALAEVPPAIFGLTLPLQAENPYEQPVDEVINALNRTNVDEQGLRQPVDKQDVPAARLAAVLNNQNGHTADNNPFDGILFKR